MTTLNFLEKFLNDLIKVKTGLLSTFMFYEYTFSDSLIRNLFSLKIFSIIPNNLTFDDLKYWNREVATVAEYLREPKIKDYSHAQKVELQLVHAPKIPNRYRNQQIATFQNPSIGKTVPIIQSAEQIKYDFIYFLNKQIITVKPVKLRMDKMLNRLVGFNSEDEFLKYEINITYTPTYNDLLRTSNSTG